MAPDPKRGFAQIANENQSASPVTAKVIEDVFISQANVALVVRGEIDAGEEVVSFGVDLAEFLNHGVSQGLVSKVGHDQLEALPFGVDIAAGPDDRVELQREGRFLFGWKIALEMLKRGFDRDGV